MRIEPFDPNIHVLFNFFSPRRSLEYQSLKWHCAWNFLKNTPTRKNVKQFKKGGGNEWNKIGKMLIIVEASAMWVGGYHTVLYTFEIWNFPYKCVRIYALYFLRYCVSYDISCICLASKPNLGVPWGGEPNSPLILFPPQDWIQYCKNSHWWV